MTLSIKNADCASKLGYTGFLNNLEVSMLRSFTVVLVTSFFGIAITQAEVKIPEIKTIKVFYTCQPTLDVEKILRDHEKNTGEKVADYANFENLSEADLIKHVDKAFKVIYGDAAKIGPAQTISSLTGASSWLTLGEVSRVYALELPVDGIVAYVKKAAQERIDRPDLHYQGWKCETTYGEVIDGISMGFAGLCDTIYPARLNVTPLPKEALELANKANAVIKKYKEELKEKEAKENKAEKN
jgi:hypothetical protein